MAGGSVRQPRLAQVGAWAGSAFARVLGFRGGLGQRLDEERERWFLWTPVALGSGIAAYFQAPSEPALGPALAALAVALVLAVLAQSTITVFVTGAFMWASLGFVVAKVRSDFVAAPILERALNNAPLEGLVELVEFRPGRGQRLTIFVTKLGTLEPSRRPYRVRVRTLAALPGLAPGQAVRLKATLTGPPPPILPGDYDFGRAAWFQRIGAVGFSVRKPEIINATIAIPLRLRFFAEVERIRQIVTLRIVTALPGERGHIAAALITGERGGITDKTNDAYRASGTFHILSISGLHMVIMAGAIFWTIRLAFVALPGVALRVPVKKWAAVAATIAALGYLLLSGSQPATQRSFLMIAMGFTAIILDRPAIALRTVALSAFSLLLIWPEVLLDLGFQMSYAAVVALVAFFEEMRERRGEPEGDTGPVWGFVLLVGGILLTTLVAGFAVWPFSAYYFHNSQQYAIIGNLLSIPICNIVVMPAALAVLVAMPLGLEWWPLQVMGLGIDAMTWVAYKVGALPGAILPVAATPDVSFQAMLFGGIWLALWSTAWRLMGVAAIAVGLALIPFKPLPDIVIAREGRLVAVRGVDGHLSGLKARGTTFEMRRILEHDGDARPVQRAFEGTAFRCDPLGCVATVKGERIAVIRHPAALPDDCPIASIVIVDTPAPVGCSPRRTLIDRWAALDRGTHVIRLLPNTIEVRTVEDVRGDRPWSLAARQAARRRAAALRAMPPSRSRLTWFSPATDLTDRGREGDIEQDFERDD